MNPGVDREMGLCEIRLEADLRPNPWEGLNVKLRISDFNLKANILPKHMT